MILTPDERRALLVLLALLLFGQGLALWEEHGRGKPDRELSRWLTALALTRGDSCSAGIDSLYRKAEAAKGSYGLEGERVAPEIPAKTRDEIPPGVLETGRILINSATAEHLDLLPGVGPVLAKRIVSYRETNGPFRSPEDLLEVSGIGPSKLAGLQNEVDWSMPSSMSIKHAGEPLASTPDSLTRQSDSSPDSLTRQSDSSPDSLTRQSDSSVGAAND